MCKCDEKFMTLQQVEGALGIAYFKLQRAAKRGLFPTYQIQNKRKLVRLSEVVAAIESSKSGEAA